MNGAFSYPELERVLAKKFRKLTEYAICGGLFS